MKSDGWLLRPGSMNNQDVASAFARVVLSLAMAVLAFASQPTAGAVPPPQFGARTNFPGGSYPYSMVVADFNRDGKPDIAITSNPGVVLLLGLGNGAFSATTNSSLSGPYYLAAGDFNNDGNLDLLILGDYGGSVLLGDGRGNFPAVTNSVSADHPPGLAMGDFNGDGKLDVACGGYLAVNIAFGRGNASFGPSTNYSLTRSPSDIRAGDLNGDGTLDIVVALRSSSSVESNSVCVLMNKGDGTFATPQYSGGASGPNEYWLSLELADINHDGSLDLVLLNDNAGSVTIQMNNGAGTFGPTHNYAVGFSPRSVAAGDFNGDGNVDLIVRGGTAAILLLGHGDGSFTVGTPMSAPSDSGKHATVGVGDFNGDGMPDIAFLDYSGGAVAVMLNKTSPLLKLTPMPGYSQISWLTTFGAGYTLECTTNPTVPGGWQPFPYPPVVLGNQKAITDWEDREQKFYRLRKP